MTGARLKWRTARLVAQPYGVGLLMVLALFVVGTAPTFEVGVGLYVVSWLAFVGWVVTMRAAFMEADLWALATLPSGLLTALFITHIPLLAGLCMFAKACI